MNLMTMLSDEGYVEDVTSRDEQILKMLEQLESKKITADDQISRKMDSLVRKLSDGAKMRLKAEHEPKPINEPKGSDMLTDNMNNVMNSFFTEAKGIYLDMMSGTLAIKNSANTMTVASKQDDEWGVDEQPFVLHEMVIPAFVCPTPIEQLNPGDILVNSDGEAVGWITNVKTGKKKGIFILTPEGESKAFEGTRIPLVDPKTKSYRVVRSAFSGGNMMQNPSVMMAMMSDDSDKMKGVLMASMMSGGNLGMMGGNTGDQGGMNNMMSMMAFASMLK